MEKRMMERKASDNRYFHQDFHISMDLSLDYVGKKFGEQGVVEYLTMYAAAYYQPLIKCIKREGFAPLVSYFEHIFDVEQAKDTIVCTCGINRLDVKIHACPAIRYMKKKGHRPSKWQVEATMTVYGTIAKQAGLAFSIVSYDENTGASTFVFEKKKG